MRRKAAFGPPFCYGAVGREEAFMEKESPAYIAESAVIAGDVSLGGGSSIWPNSTLRGDLASIVVGKRSNIQDGAVLHVALGLPCVIGEDVTVGHGAIVHGCRVGDACIVGMGSILLNGCEIGPESIVGAGSLVTEGRKFPPKSLLIGNPARLVRELSGEEVQKIRQTAASYIELAERARAEEAALYKARRLRHTGNGSNTAIEEDP
jgi:carbonic anhydrase/acetyltransferase-like protein (isoleucine patch superfamily)